MLANVLWAQEYANRYGSKGITAVAVHPGAVATRAQRHLVGEGCLAFLAKCCLKGMIRMIPVWPGSQTTLHAVLSDNVAQHNGKYFAQAFSPSLPFGQPVYEKSEQDSGGWPMSEQPSAVARDPANSARLWELSTQAVQRFLP
eukprot:TRINITY_DN17342_c0_g1_i1.p1 TRINITY_DN17342_c0_g1~~TRINITY_DN17342_c0_g1_i1.p1  ORF type:complete len:143 (-),score=13.40 TRINITY_DN17342_c0_g1_i1:81-509(-)